MSHYAFDRISEGDFDDILSQYSETVPTKLADLEEQRLETIPASLNERKTNGKPCLTREEVDTLVDWKLSHGTFRPSLKGLVQQNTDKVLEGTTSEAFSKDDWNESLKCLVTLRGIGPATASLLLSTYKPQECPFFSDELFRWAFWEHKNGSRWDRKIKYSLTEYRQLVARVDELRKRIGRSALEVEKVAYVLGKRKVLLGESEQTHQAETAPEATKETPPKRKSPNAEKTSTHSKRKAVESATGKQTPGQQPTKKQKTPVASTSLRVTRSSKIQ